MEITKINQLKIELIEILKVARKWYHLEHKRFENPHRRGQESDILGFSLCDIQESMRWAGLRQLTCLPSGSCGAWMMNNHDTIRKMEISNTFISNTQYVWTQYSNYVTVFQIF